MLSEGLVSSHSPQSLSFCVGDCTFLRPIFADYYTRSSAPELNAKLTFCVRCSVVVFANLKIDLMCGSGDFVLTAAYPAGALSVKSSADQHGNRMQCVIN